MWQVRDVRREGIGSRFTLAGPDGAVLEARTGLPGDFNVANAALALLMVTTRLLAIAAAGAGVDLPPRAGSSGSRTRWTATTRSRWRCPGACNSLAPLLWPLWILRTTPTPWNVPWTRFGPTPPARASLPYLVPRGSAMPPSDPSWVPLWPRGADVVIITDDDPHNEDPAAIRAEVLAGAREANRSGALGRLVEEFDQRAHAIARAVELATPQDVILVAGRGHEVFQEVKGVNISLDDRVELRAALPARGFPLSRCKQDRVLN